MKKFLVISVCLLSFAAMAASALAADSYYHFKGQLGLTDVNVINSQNTVDAGWTEATGHYNAWFADGDAKGHLKVTATAADGSKYYLAVKWSSENGYGITVTQNDNYAIKFLANAKVTRNGEVKYNQPVYVNYSKITGSFVVRGTGFRVETKPVQ